MNWQFQYPQAFWLLCLIPFLIILFLLYQRWRKKTYQRIGKPSLVAALTNNRSRGKITWKFILLLLAFALGCLSLANPRKPDETNGQARKGIDMVIALDLSNSMLAGDVQPSRLVRAKEFISRLLNSVPDDRIGLVIFAGTAYEQMPLSFDQDAARMYLAAAQPGNLAAQGTSISDALTKCNMMLGDQQDRFRSVLLITDGETHDENALQLAQDLAKKGVMINTIGMGSAEGASIIDSTGSAKRDASGQPVVSRLNEQLLQQIATVTKGTYIHLDNIDDAAKKLLAQFNQIDKKSLGDTTLYNYESYFMWPAGAMLLLLLIQLFIPDRKKVKT